MFESEIRLFGFMQGYCQMVTADIEDSELAHCHYPGSNPPGWILGHLAIAADHGVTLLGGERACPEEWQTKFGRGSTPSTDREAYPSKSALMEAYVGGHERVVAALGSVTEAFLDEPHGMDALNQTPMVTKGDFLRYLMIGHESGHIAQLSMWRRQMGRSSLF